METRIGISGWRYKPWKGDFYPPGLPARDELKFVSQNLNSVEINGSFYALQSPKSYKHWYEQTVSDFVFSIKGSRYITHLKRLKDIEAPLANFFASGVFELREKLGPFLWQFPPGMRLDMERFTHFFSLLPHTGASALRLARKHDQRMEGKTSLSIDRHLRLRHAVEVRNESFRDPAFYKLLRKHNISLVMSDGAGKWPYFNELTAGFVYVRLHGSEKLYESGYTRQALEAWEKNIRAWQKTGKDVYLYFDNDIKVHAPYNAMALLNMLTGFDPPAFEEEELALHSG